MSLRTDHEQWVPVDVHHETGCESILSEAMKRLTQTPIWNKQTKNNGKKKGEGEEWWRGSGALGRRKNTRTVCVNRCVLFCFECSGPVSLHVKWADGASERLRAACPLPSGGLPFHSGAWNTEHREGQKDTASELLKDRAEQLKRGLQFQTRGFRQK